MGSIRKNSDNLAPYMQQSNETHHSHSVKNGKRVKGLDEGEEANNRIVLKNLTKNDSSPELIDHNMQIIQSNGSRENLSSCSEKHINDIMDLGNTRNRRNSKLSELNHR